MSYCSQKKLDRQKDECTKKKELEQIEIELAAKPSIESMLKFERLKSDILAIETERINGAIIRSKIRWVEEGEKSTIFFFDLEKKNNIKKHIRKLKLSNGIVTTDPVKIDSEIEHFYSKLYKANEIIDHDDTFIATENVPKLTQQERDFCDGPITENECKLTLKTFKKSKSPGNDGLTCEFYMKFWDLLQKPLVKSFNAAYNAGELTISQRQALITLIEKTGKDRESLKNWRPISLLNLDYKLLSKSISIRMQQYLPKLIHQNQSGFVKGRFIGDSVRIIQDLMAYMDQKKLNGILLFVDFEKAFDTIEW